MTRFPYGNLTASNRVISLAASGVIRSPPGRGRQAPVPRNRAGVPFQYATVNG